MIPKFTQSWESRETEQALANRLYASDINTLFVKEGLLSINKSRLKKTFEPMCFPSISGLLLVEECCIFVFFCLFVWLLKITKVIESGEENYNQSLRARSLPTVFSLDFLIKKRQITIHWKYHSLKQWHQKFGALGVTFFNLPATLFHSTPLIEAALLLQFSMNGDNMDWVFMYVLSFLVMTSS